MLENFLLKFISLTFCLEITCRALTISGSVIGLIDTKKGNENSYQFTVKCVLRAETEEMDYLAEIINITSISPGECKHPVEDTDCENLASFVL